VALFGAGHPNTIAPGSHPNGTLFVNTSAMTTTGVTLYVYDTLGWVELL
jgi:hypothetical protein